MPRINVNSFSGMIPKRGDALLPESAAVIAENCKLTDGRLRAYNAPLEDHTLSGDPETIYLYRNEGKQHWFAFDRDVDVVPSPIADDANNRVYMTGHVKGARWTDNVLALVGGNHYPVNTRQLGIPEPETTPLTEVEGLPEGVDAQGVLAGRNAHDAQKKGFTYYATDTRLLYTKVSDDFGDWDEGSDRQDDFQAETRHYVTTWVTLDGKEGPPSLPSAAVEWQQGQTIKLTVSDSPGGVDLAISHFRVYVTRGDGHWWLCDQIQHGDEEVDTDVPVGVTTVWDITPTDNRREQLVTSTWVAPPRDLKGIKLLPGGVAVGFRGKELFFSEPYILYAWPPQYRLTLEYEIVALETAGNSVYITTRGNPYVCFGTDPQAMTLERLDASQVCLSKRSMIDMGYQAIYASPDGLISIAGSQPQLITRQVISGEDWRSRYKPEQIHAYFHDDKYYGFNDQGGFIFDTTTGSLVDIDFLGGVPACGFSDLESDNLYLCTGRTIRVWDSDQDNQLVYRWRSREYKGTPIKFNSCRIMAESYEHLSFTLIRDGEEVMTNIPVVNDKAFRLPVGAGSTWQFELRGTDTVNSVTLASSMMEL